MRASSARTTTRALALAAAAAALALPRTVQAPAPWHEVRSNDGAFVVRYRTTPAELRLGADFDVEVELVPPEGGALPAGLDLRIDGDMPEHGHGLLRTPRTERLGPARFRARELRLFMPGYWELYFDLTHGAVTERAQAAVVIE